MRRYFTIHAVRLFLDEHALLEGQGTLAHKLTHPNCLRSEVFQVCKVRRRWECPCP